ncbi:MAG TPA: ribonuclease HII [Bacteroidales bacterium]|nr:ribonuclease HII [Bacteroidales bacterium]
METLINIMLKSCCYINLKEAGCDEAGRGCLAGPVAAAAVILPRRFKHPVLNDSKQLTAKQRDELKFEIMDRAIAWKVAFVDNEEIDKINILRASIKAMHIAIEGLEIIPEFLLIDGNRFYPYKDFKYKTIIRGDGTYFSIAAASVLAKTFRDEYMEKLHNDYPIYGWDTNKGYPTPEHRDAILRYGLTPFHRKTFGICDTQLELELED